MERLRKPAALPEASPADLAGRSFACSCGREHAIPLRRLATHPGSLQEVGPFLQAEGASRCWLVADEQTYEAAGRDVAGSCRAAGVAVRESILPAEPPPHPDRNALGRLAFDLQPGREPLLAVGAGTVSDLARFLAHRTGSFFVAVPTAPTVDGFTSSVAAMLVDGVRVTFPAVPPRALFADPRVFSRAPRFLIASGYAEMVGKLTALADWRLAEALNGEYLCPVAEEMVARAALPLLQDPSSPEALMEGLIGVGVAMLMVGNSRPASGAEHHLAHYWEMRALWEGREPPLHGMRVGVASALIQQVHEELFQRRTDLLSRQARVAAGATRGTEAEIRSWFGPVAGRVLAEQASWSQAPYGPRPLTAARLTAARQAVASYRYDAGEIRAFLRRVGAPALPRELGVGAEALRTSLRAAKEIRQRFTVLHLAAELDLLDAISEAVAGAAEGEAP